MTHKTPKDREPKMFMLYRSWQVPYCISGKQRDILFLTKRWLNLPFDHPKHYDPEVQVHMSIGSEVPISF